MLNYHISHKYQVLLYGVVANLPFATSIHILLYANMSIDNSNIGHRKASQTYIIQPRFSNLQLSRLTHAQRKKRVIAHLKHLDKVQD
jgi:hypothetical protein